MAFGKMGARGGFGSLGAATKGGPPAGFAFLVGPDGAYLLDPNGSYMIGQA